MSFHSIKELEQLSNIKAHTIRTWEQRYDLLQPDRTDTNIRLYDDDQLKRLLNVCALIDRGMKISRISRLTDKEISKEIDNLIEKSENPDFNVKIIINQLIVAISAFDETLFEKTFANAVLRFGFEQCYSKIVYPVLVRTGMLWTKDDIMPAQEHFLTHLLKQKFFAAIDALPFPNSSGQTWLLFLDEKEEHELGLLFANYILRANGRKVIYLGPKVPYNNLKNVMQTARPTHIFTSFVRKQSEDDFGRFMKRLLKDFPEVKIYWSASPEYFELREKFESVSYLINADALLDLLK